MKKRLLSALLALCMILSLFPASAFASTGDTWGGVNASTLSAPLADLDAENAGTTVTVKTVKDFTDALANLAKKNIDTINLSPDSGTLDLSSITTGSALQISQAVTINGNGSTVNFGSKGLTIAPKSGASTYTVTLNNMTITGGTASSKGQCTSIIQVGNKTSHDLTLNLNSVVFNGCTPKQRVIYVISGCTLNMTSSTIQNSNNLQNAIQLDSNSTLIMDGSQINNCKVTQADSTGNVGSVIKAESGSTLTMKGSSITNCSTKYSGGGAYISAGATLNMDGTSKITGCSAELVGGGVYSQGGTLNIQEGAAVYGNSAKSYAADLYANADTTITHLPTASGIVGGKDVTGWYKDESSKRHSEDKPNDEVDPANLSKDPNGKLTEPLSLVASRSSAYTVTTQAKAGETILADALVGAYDSADDDATLITSSTKDKTVYLSAPSSYTGDGKTYYFTDWTVTQTNGSNTVSVTKVNDGSNTFSFQMPAYAVTATANYVQAYKVTVTGGEAKADGVGENTSINVVAGTEVTITSALSDTGDTVFSNWTTDNSSTGLTIKGNTDTVNGSTSRSVTFVMPAHDVTLTSVAKYKVTVPDGTTVTINDETVTGNSIYAKEGDTVNLTYNSADQQFNGWTVTKKNNETVTVDNNGTFTMPASPVTATADTSQLYNITVKYQFGNTDAATDTEIAGAYSDEDHNNSITQSVAEGTVYLNAVDSKTATDGSTYVFDSWTVATGQDNPVDSGNRKNPVTSFAMPEYYVILTAKYVRVYTVTVDGDKLTNPKTHTEYFAEGDDVSFTSKYPAELSGEDTVFDSWNRDSESTDLTINNSTGANNTIQGSFTMPAHNVVLTSRPQYKVTVAGGTVTKLYSTSSLSASSMYVTEGTTISIASSYGAASANPDETSDDIVFYKWTSSNYSTLNESTSQTVTVLMPAQPITVTSVNKYKVTVVGGKYGAQHVNFGYEEAGHQISLTLDPVPAGKTFKCWVVTPENSGATVDENSVTTPNPGMAITITANYDDNLYTVYVNNEPVRTGVKATDSVTLISANAGNLTKETADSTEDVVFGEWSVDTTKGAAIPDTDTSFDKTDPNTSFSMPAGNVYLTYSKKYKVTVTDGTINNTDKNSGYFAPGDDVKLNYTGNGVIKNWTVGNETIEDGSTYKVKESAVTIEPVLKNQPNFTFTEPKGLVEGEDLTPNDVENAVRNGLSSDDVNMKDTDKVHLTYYDKAGNELEEAPRTAGSYTFKVTIDADDTQAGGTFTNNDFLKFTIEAPVTPEEPADGDGGIGGAIAAGALIGGATYLVGTHVWLNNIYGFIPTNRIELAKALWNKADCPAPVSTELYPDIDEDDTDAQSAARWVVEQGLMKDYTRTNDDGTQTVTFKPGRYVFRPYALSRWYELEKLLNEQQAAQAEAPAETTAD